MERKGLNLKISEMDQVQKQFRSLLHQQKIKMQEQKSYIARQNMLLVNKDQEYARLAREHRTLRQEIQQATEDSMMLHDEKSRLMGVNNIL